MDNRVTYAIMTIVFNAIGVPCFMRGDTVTGILRIVLGIVSCSVLFVINEVMGIILGIKILKMTDEEFEAQKDTLIAGIPKMSTPKDQTPPQDPNVTA